MPSSPLPPRSSHYVMLTQPDLIIDQLRRVVRLVRHTGR